MKPLVPDIRTERLLLRELNPGLSDWLFHQADPEEQQRFFGCASREALHGQVRRFRDSLVSNARFSFRHWLLVQAEDGTVIGDAGYHTWHIQHARAELGYGLRSEEWGGRGFMSEALERILQLGFGDMDLYRVEAFVSPYNRPSLAILHRLGFEREGCLRGHFRANGRQNDAWCYALLRPQWASR
jgi:ribosomal-protein-alanine N-acetyltransferase